jgi:hypothetical protein
MSAVPLIKYRLEIRPGGIRPDLYKENLHRFPIDHDSPRKCAAEEPEFPT